MSSKRRCKGKVHLSNNQIRNCKLFAQLNSEFCHKHQNLSKVMSVNPVSDKKDFLATVSNPLEVIHTSLSQIPKNILDELVSATLDRINISPLYVEKDIYVTDTIRFAVVQSKLYPRAQTVFIGGTALAKAGWVNRFSEDIDIRYVPPDQAVANKTKYYEETHSKLCEELLDNTLLRDTNLVKKSSVRYPTYSNVLLGYDTMYPEHVAPIADITIEEVKVEYATRSLLPGYQDTREINSYIGETAALLNPALLNKYPALRPFTVLGAKPAVSIVDKLDALNYRAENDLLEHLANRARDVIDIASLLSNPTIRSTVNTDVVIALHNNLVENMPPGPSHMPAPCPRPREGFAMSKAFQPGEPACEALRESYQRVKQYMFSDADWIEFDDALEIIRDNAHLL